MKGKIIEGEDNSVNNNSLIEGSWALQFQIGSNFNLSAFQGLAISAKRHYTANNALRLGVSINSLTMNKDESALSKSTSDTSSGKLSGDDISFSINIVGMYLRYITFHKNINVFYGFGPLIGYGYYFSEASYENEYLVNGSIYKSKSKNSSNSISFGTTGILGVEWFFSPEMSLHAEYGIEAFYHFYKSKRETKVELALSGSFQTAESTSESTSDVGAFQLKSTGVKFGISIYF